MPHLNTYLKNRRCLMTKEPNIKLFLFAIW
jgi:hypothetical protein